MRIVAGQLRGRRIPSHRCLDSIRLTAAPLKEAVFSMLGPAVSGARFLDLCAGSGQIGLEAVSRGAEVVINEPHPRRAAQIEALVRLWRAGTPELHRMPAQRLIQVLAAAGRRFDVVYVDPPYEAWHHDRPLAAALLEQLATTPVLNPGALVLVQHRADLSLPGQQGSLGLERHRAYGSTHLSVYAQQSGAP